MSTNQNIVTSHSRAFAIIVATAISIVIQGVMLLAIQFASVELPLYMVFGVGAGIFVMSALFLDASWRTQSPAFTRTAQAPTTAKPINEAVVFQEPLKQEQVAPAANIPAQPAATQQVSVSTKAMEYQATIYKRIVDALNSQDMDALAAAYEAIEGNAVKTFLDYLNINGIYLAAVTEPNDTSKFYIVSLPHNEIAVKYLNGDPIVPPPAKKPDEEVIKEKEVIPKKPIDNDPDLARYQHNSSRL